MLIKSSFFELKNFYNLAHQGDNLTAGIEIDCADIAEDGDTAAVLIRGVDGSSYPALSTFEDKMLRYSFTSADLKYPGNIYFQAAIYGTNKKIKHSKVTALHIIKSIAGDDEPPEAFRAWLDEAVEVLEKLKHSGGSAGAVTSVNGQTGDVSLTAADVGALPTETPIPTVPAWIGDTKPAYTASEIADGDSNVGAEIIRLKEDLASKADKTGIPESLPNPNALTFTGAVSGAYDGSAPLSVEIPQGGGTSEFTALLDIMLEEASVVRAEITGLSTYKVLEVYIEVPKLDTGIGNVHGTFGGANLIPYVGANTSTMHITNAIIWQVAPGNFMSLKWDNPGNMNYSTANAAGKAIFGEMKNDIIEIRGTAQPNALPVGSQIKMWGKK